VNSSGETTLKYDVSAIVESVQPSIVSITTQSTITQQYFFTSYTTPQTGAGSGIIIAQDDENIYVATNYHVIGGAEEIRVGLNDGEAVDATVKGYNEDADIAVIVMKKSDLKESTKNSIVIANVGDSEALKVGEPAIAIGNALGYGQSVTVGYISALNRTIEGSEGTFIQTDAAINPGNSGGALIDAKGNVIGINSVKYVDSTVEGMGFSIPINNAMTIIQDIIDGKQTGNTYLGITGATISSDYAQIYGFPEGIYVKEITPGSPAEKAELHPGDIIVAFDGDEVYTMEELQSKIRSCEIGQEVKLEIYRADTMGNYDKTEVTATLEMER
jgi:serine protease Do